MLFCPTSLLFTILIGIIFGVIFIGFIPLKEIVFLPLSWTICPITFFVTLNKTMPKGKRITTNILVGIWLLLRAYELFRLLTSELLPETFEPYENTSSPWVVLFISSLVQTISLSFFLCIYNKKYKSNSVVAGGKE
jgi:hypothetical protein